jgi:hypothetical protein
MALVDAGGVEHSRQTFEGVIARAEQLGGGGGDVSLPEDMRRDGRGDGLQVDGLDQLRFPPWFSEAPSAVPLTSNLPRRCAARPRGPDQVTVINPVIPGMA